MIHSTCDLQLVSVETAEALLKAHFSTDRGTTLKLTVNNTHNSLRLHFKDNLRLFFFTAQALGTTRFENEYGQTSGRLRPAAVHRGTIYIGNHTYQYRFAGDDPHVLIHPAGQYEGLRFEVNDELLLHPAGDKSMAAFLFSFGLVYNLQYGPDVPVHWADK